MELSSVWSLFTGHSVPPLRSHLPLPTGYGLLNGWFALEMQRAIWIQKMSYRQVPQHCGVTPRWVRAWPSDVSRISLALDVDVLDVNFPPQPRIVMGWAEPKVGRAGNGLGNLPCQLLRNLPSHLLLLTCQEPLPDKCLGSVVILLSEQEACQWTIQFQP